jgi:hypothetical protein
LFLRRAEAELASTSITMLARAAAAISQMS